VANGGRNGLTAAYLRVLDAAGGHPMTASEVDARSEVRSAGRQPYRTLYRLERHGLAVRAGSLNLPVTGGRAVLWRVRR
jgi:hypothetical protein